MLPQLVFVQWCVWSYEQTICNWAHLLFLNSGGQVWRMNKMWLFGFETDNCCDVIDNVLLYNDSVNQD